MLYMGLTIMLVAVIVGVHILLNDKPSDIGKVLQRASDLISRSIDENPKEDGTEVQTDHLSAPSAAGETDTYADAQVPTILVTRLLDSEFKTLESGLPLSVLEEFESTFYVGCDEPPLEELVVLQSWAGHGTTELEIKKPPGTYALIVEGSNFGPQWHFDSVYEMSDGKLIQSLSINSDFPRSLTDASMWCYGLVSPITNVLHVDSSDVDWRVHLVAIGTGEPLNRNLSSALSGFYHICPPLPPMDMLRTAIMAEHTSSDNVGSISFFAEAPHFFIGVQFEPMDEEWEFDSVDVSGNWASPGPSVSSATGQTIDFTSTCLSEPSKRHHLKVSAYGGMWTVYLIKVWTPK